MRLLMVVFPAAIVTFSLQMVMVSLIQFADRRLDESTTVKLPEIAMPEVEIKTQRQLEKPEKPQLDDTPPPDVPEQAFDNIDGNAQIGALGGVDQLVAKLDLSMGAGLSASDGEYLPIVKVAPQYPRRALKRGLEGDVVLEYTVTKQGSVRNPKVLQSTDSVFNQAAIDSALRYKYKPRVINGEAQEVPAVRTRIKFRMSNG
ncbi:TonB2 protein [Oceanococcus atlanticus]|uniref:TonB2 protein n=1 Tax=Oceanococcus atlanticus TaxID=1317117 RepID=A0A1Y1SCE7_9GAMM|nr:energy transducer TonB [Oceanococcus atlanticus]ORE86302.1 TonB2 protein [Oceanococcus atlanticus]